MDKFKESFNRFMQGRYGIDILGKRLNGLFIILALSSLALSLIGENSSYLSALTLATLVFMYYRILSKDYGKRMRENQAYKNLETKVLTPLIKLKRKLFGTKDHVYTSCPSCKAEIRIPRGKGKLKVTCPKCRHIFVKRT